MGASRNPVIIICVVAFGIPSFNIFRCSLSPPCPGKRNEKPWDSVGQVLWYPAGEAPSAAVYCSSATRGHDNSRLREWTALGNDEQLLWEIILCLVCFLFCHVRNCSVFFYFNFAISVIKELLNMLIKYDFVIFISIFNKIFNSPFFSIFYQFTPFFI